MTTLQPLIEQVEESEFSHVVVFLSETAIHWRPQTFDACSLMAEILSDYQAEVLPKEDFLEMLRAAE